MSEKKTSQTFSHRYEILDDLGQGGIGKVYRAHDRWTKKDVALKVVADCQADSSLQDLKNEFLLLAELKHPGVVNVLDFGYSEAPSQRQKRLPYFTMEFVEGKSLQEAFPALSDPEGAPAEFKELYHLIWQICDILEFLHLRGLVHCDLKPDNLKVTDKSFRPKVLDFGLSERPGAGRGREAKGTLPYMAPEMLKEEPLDGRTDLYSLGIILYELVTSRLPFFNDDPVKIVSAHLQQKPVSPSQLNCLLPSSLDGLIMKLLEKSPANRPTNATRVKEILESGLRRDFKPSRNQDLSGQNNLASHLLSGPLVGRETELGQLEAHLEQAVSSEKGCLFLSGEQGVGKTFLFRHLKMKCQLRGIIFVDSYCLENQTTAYQPLIQILHRLKPYVENKCAGQVLTDLGEVLNWPQGDPSPSSQAQISFHQRITDLLAEISLSFPFLMVFENLQWADPPTLRFLEHFQRQRGKDRIFLCGSMRDEAKEEGPLNDLMNRCLKEGGSKHLKLNRFDLPTTRDLISSKFVADEFPSAFSAVVHRRTSGNPFFIIEVLKYLVQKNVVTLKDSVWTADVEKLDEATFPDSIEAVLLKNLERYDQRTFEFLSTAAVAGRGLTPRLLTRLSRLDEKTTSEILSCLTRDQLFTRKEESDRDRTHYEFANQSLQNLLYKRLDEAKRIGLHKAMGMLLEERSSDEEAEESVFNIAFHYLRGREFRKAYQYALLCAEKMKQRFANQEVLKYLGEAIEVSSRLSETNEALEKQVAARRKRADFCKTVGELDQAEKDYTSVLKLIESSTDLKSLAETYNGLGETYRLKHDYRKAISQLEKAMEIHKELNDPLELAHTLSYLGLAYWTDSQYQNALESFRVALEIDRRLDNKSYMASTLNNIGLVYWSRRQYHQALKHFEDSLSLYRELDNKEWIARSLNNIGATFFELGQYRECIDHFHESFKINEEIKNEKEMAFNLENLSEAHRKIGDYSVALQYGRKGLKLASEIGFPGRVGRISKDLGTAHFELGEYTRAFRCFQEARDTAERIGDKELQISVLIALSKLGVALNDGTNATRSLREAADLIDTVDDEKSLIAVHQIRSCLKRKEREFDEADRFLGEASALARKLNLGEEIFSLNLERAELGLDRGDIYQSKEFLSQAGNAGLERYVLLQPTSHLISGRAELMSGNLKSAKREFETALKLAEKLNNSEILWQTHHQLAKLLLSAHDIEKAYAELKNAARVLKELSENVKDDELKQNYLKDPKKDELLSDLKKVAGELIGKAPVGERESQKL